MFTELQNSYRRLSAYVKRMYLLYTLNTYIAICEPWEKVFLNTVIISCISIVFYSTFVYIPGHMKTLIMYLMPVGGLNNKGLEVQMGTEHT